jgi:Leucine-rich repeat (LRR) protein
LTEFPDDISSLLHLSELWIASNKLKQFPSQLPPNLVRLHLLRNSITSISSTTFSSLTRLEILNLSLNQITILPTQIGLLTSLQDLCLNHNKLSFIPTDLNSLSNLTYLSIDMNPIRVFPIIRLYSLQQLFFEGPTKFPPTEMDDWNEFCDILDELYKDDI